MNSARRRRILPGLLLALSLMATGTATAVDQGHAPGAAGKVSAAEEAPARTAGGIDANRPTGVPAPTKTRPATMDSRENCEPTPAGSRERKAGAVQACVTTSATPVTQVGRKFLAAGRPPGAAPPAAARPRPARRNPPRPGGLSGGWGMVWVVN
ncbi:hypothetical protein ACFXA3_40235 [Streptomyces sp. NPDC059456]|uniref:hypothetical protein n=1 Tax=Streptomyces sp. NPDC059456 TaxID=3346838 RepID=UPI0036B26D4A